MTGLELLAPARNAAIGIAAIDCGADAVYIAGPAFGARKDAGNEIANLAPLFEHAHKFGAKVFITFNIEVRDDELEAMHSMMLECQNAGADAFIIRDERICRWSDITVPLHASTQCAIRDASRTGHFAGLGCTRVVLERELSLSQVREISASCGCEVECFVHGALCVCYSGDCRLSEHIDGRSADRGECIQACRSLYDLVDESGRVLVRNKALLSLKDLNLIDRLEEMAEAGVMSFKIEGRLKNASYVRNVVRAYSLALDRLVAAHPDKYRRASFGSVSCGFTPDLNKTFNRGYTQVFFDGRRERGWSSMDAPKSMGELIGKVQSIRKTGKGAMEIAVSGTGASLRNGDGFAFIGKNAIIGFRGDICEGNNIVCKYTPELYIGALLYRNISSSFEKEVEKGGRRYLGVSLKINIKNNFVIRLDAECEDGRTTSCVFAVEADTAQNRQRAEAMLREGLGKSVNHYSCTVDCFDADGALPFLNPAFINTMRRSIIEQLDALPAPATSTDLRPKAPADSAKATAVAKNSRELMRSKYCIKYELGLCPVHQGAKPAGSLFLLNNGRRLALGFDCRNCEMTVCQTDS